MPSPIFIAGPTASGKSDLALHLAERLGGEIISVDSMQVYRGLDIGTAKPTPTERSRTPHHLIDILDLAETFDAAQFLRLARQSESEIRERGRLPIYCGGTGLYFKALAYGLGHSPGSDPELHRELESTPLDILLEELRTRDPNAFAAIDQKNPRRIIRAVEVLRLSGRPFSEQKADWSPQTPPGHWIALNRHRPELYERINRRVDHMFQSGLVEETKSLLPFGLETNRTAMQAIGYRQVVEYLRGERALPETISLIKQKTRHFAKRQLTWFKHQLDLHWFDLERDESAAQTANRVFSWLESKT